MMNICVFLEFQRVGNMGDAWLGGWPQVCLTKLPESSQPGLPQGLTGTGDLLQALLSSVRGLRPSPAAPGGPRFSPWAAPVSFQWASWLPTGWVIQESEGEKVHPGWEQQPSYNQILRATYHVSLSSSHTPGERITHRHEHREKIMRAI